MLDSFYLQTKRFFYLQMCPARFNEYRITKKKLGCFVFAPAYLHNVRGLNIRF